MNTWTAPLIVGIIGGTGGLLVGEPAASLIFITIALIGYSLNRKAN